MRGGGGSPDHAESARILIRFSKNIKNLRAMKLCGVVVQIM